MENAVKIKSTKGFSLIEILVVMALAAILLSIAAPNFNKFRYNSNLKEAAREVSGEIQLCKQRAVTENLIYLIIFNTGNNNYTIKRQKRSVSVPSVSNASDWDIIVNNKAVGANYNNAIRIFSINDSTFTFLPRGTTAETDGDVVLVIQHSKRQSTAEITTTLMGRVRVIYDLK